MSAAVVMHCRTFVLFAADTRAWQHHADGTTTWHDDREKIAQTPDGLFVAMGYTPWPFPAEIASRAGSHGETLARLEDVHEQLHEAMPDWMPADARTMGMTAAFTRREASGLKGWIYWVGKYVQWLRPGDARALLTLDVPRSVRAGQQEILRSGVRPPGPSEDVARSARYHAQLARQILGATARHCPTVSPQAHVGIHWADGRIEIATSDARVCYSGR